MSLTLSRTAAVLLVALSLAACASPTVPAGDSGSSSETDTSSDSGSPSGTGDVPTPPDVQLAACPDTLTAYYAQYEGTLIDVSEVSALTDIRILPSCVFTEDDLSDEAFYTAYYITDQGSDVIDYFNRALASAGYDSQVGDSTQEGTWQVGDYSVGASVITEPDDANPPAAIIGTEYVDVFIAK